MHPRPILCLLLLGLAWLAPGAARADDSKFTRQADVIYGRKYGLARTTVRRAIAVLVDEGLVFTVPQRGTYVSAVSDGSPGSTESLR